MHGLTLVYHVLSSIIKTDRHVDSSTPIKVDQHFEYYVIHLPMFANVFCLTVHALKVKMFTSLLYAVTASRAGCGSWATKMLLLTSFVSKCGEWAYGVLVIRLNLSL